MQNGREPPAYPIASVDNALRLLAVIANREQIRVSEAASMLGTARSTAHRLLAMLEYHGFALQDNETKSYTAGPALVNLGLSAVEGLDLRRRARPVLEQLCETVGETVHLARLHDASVVFVDSVETTRGLRVGSRVGRFMPAHCTACGKAILAELSADELQELYPGGRLEGMTSRSVSTLKQLESELQKVRKQGYATNFGESEDDVASVAVAIPDQPRSGLAAITISAPLTRMDPRLVRRAGDAALGAAAELRHSTPV